MKLTKPVQRRRETLKTTTLREFNGGLNVIDNDLNLSPTYAKELTNLLRGSDGAITLRFGTKLFVDFAPIGFTRIVNHWYYNNRLVAVDVSGLIGTSTGDGVIALIWSPAIAATRVGKPRGWGSITFASAAQFNGDLIICNGIDKPVLVEPSFTVNYLQDLATGSNLFVPICRYVATADRYLVMAGDPFAPDTLYISNRDTSGTWEGAPAPNDGTSLRLGSVVPSGSAEIQAVANFRDKLIVDFTEVKLVVALGIYNDTTGDHTPDYTDPIEQYGAVSHRSVQGLGDDILFCDIVGVNSVTKSLVTQTIRPERVSQIIDPEIQKRIANLKTTSSLQDGIFSVFNRQEQEYMLFIPAQSDNDTVSETICYDFKNIRSLKINAWSVFRNWNWQSACRSAQGRVFFSKGTQLYLYGAINEPYYADYIGDQETFDDSTVFEDGSGWTPVADVNDSGVPIKFAWELPWADFDQRMHTKHSKYIALDTQGEARFTLSMFVDNIVQNAYQGETFLDATLFDDLTGWDTEAISRDPALSAEFAGGGVLGYGGEGYGNYYGGGRPTNDERLLAWPAKFRIAKFRVEGETMKALKIVSLSIIYGDGSIRR